MSAAVRYDDPTLGPAWQGNHWGFHGGIGSKYLTPAGADITGLGLEPSVVAADDPLTQRDEGLSIARRALVELLRAE